MTDDAKRIKLLAPSRPSPHFARRSELRYSDLARYSETFDRSTAREIEAAKQSPADVMMTLETVKFLERWKVSCFLRTKLFPKFRFARNYLRSFLESRHVWLRPHGVNQSRTWSIVRDVLSYWILQYLPLPRKRKKRECECRRPFLLADSSRTRVPLCLSRTCLSNCICGRIH